MRDKIPQIIRSKGKEPIVYVVDAEEYAARLRDKPTEEVAESSPSDNEPEDRADTSKWSTPLPSRLARREATREAEGSEAGERGGFAGRVIWSGNHPADPPSRRTPRRAYIGCGSPEAISWANAFSTAGPAVGCVQAPRSPRRGRSATNSIIGSKSVPELAQCAVRCPPRQACPGSAQATLAEGQHAPRVRPGEGAGRQGGQSSRRILPRVFRAGSSAFSTAGASHNAVDMVCRRGGAVGARLRSSSGGTTLWRCAPPSARGHFELGRPSVEDDRKARTPEQLELRR